VGVIDVRPARSEDEARVYLETHARVFPGTGTLDAFRHRERTWDSVHFVAFLDGDPAGSGWTGPRQEEALWCGFGAVATSRGRGVGTALYREISGVARSRAPTGLFLEVLAADPESLAWVERRGFREVERQEALALDLISHEPDPVAAPAGVEVVTRAARPDLARQMYEVGVAAARDIPGLDGSSDPSFEQWAAFEIERPSRDPELCFIALADGHVIGFASLDVFPDDVFHGLTAVAREWRGRGVATALKRSQIAAAKERGFPRLLTESQHENEPMRRLNEKLGFRPEASLSTIVLRGRLSD
jgi:ribosomal protein S18 acetylase RimI-like enzyme